MKSGKKQVGLMGGLRVEMLESWTVGRSAVSMVSRLVVMKGGEKVMKSDKKQVGLMGGLRVEKWENEMVGR